MKARKFTALLGACACTLGLAGATLAFPARAAADPVTMSAASRTLRMDTGNGMPLSGLRVVLGDQTLEGTAVEWSAQDGLTVADGQLTATKTGVHKLTASQGARSLDIYVAAKAAADDEYVLYEESFDDVADGSLPEGWTRTQGSEANVCVQDGKLLQNAKSGGTCTLLPAFLEAFGDYQVEADLQIVEYNDTGRWSALMFRVQDQSRPYYQMCVRAGATMGNGVEFSEMNERGWNVMKTGSYTEALDPAKSYRLTVRAEGDRIIESINGRNVIDATVTGLRKTGGVGIQVNGNMSLFDNVRVVIPTSPIPDLPQAADPFTPETGLTNPPAVVTAPQTAAELQTLVDAAEPPSHVLLSVDETLKTVGLSLHKALETIGTACIPVLAVESEAAADGVTTFLNNWRYVDVLVLSQDPQLVSRMRAAAPLVGGIVDYSAAGVRTPSTLLTQASAAGANILVLPGALADKETVSYFQERFVTVWTAAPETLDVAGAVDLTATGTNGIMTTQPSVCYDAYRVFRDQTYLARRPFIIGHRGVPTLAPENTLEGAQKAYELGARLIECDIYLTADNQIVIMHDGSIDRTTDGTGAVESYTLAELKRYKANTGFTDDYPEARIPTLDEYFTDFKDKDVVLVIEIKSGKPEILDHLKTLIDEHDIADQCVAISFYKNQLLETARVIPELPLGLLANPYGDTDLAATVDSFLRDIRPVGAIYSPYTDGLSAAFCRAMSLRGLTTSVWTIDSVAFGKTLLGMNASHITTNRVQDYMPLIGTVEAAQTAYTLNQGGSLTLTANARTLAGDEQVQPAELVPISGGSHITVDGNQVTGQSAGTVKAVLRVPMDAQKDLYLFSGVITIEVQGPSPDTGDDNPPDSGDDNPPDSGDDNPPDSGNDTPPDTGNDTPPDAGKDDTPDTDGQDSPDTGAAMPWLALLAGGAAIIALSAASHDRKQTRGR